MAVLVGLELFMHVSKQILFELIDPLFHKVPHDEILVRKMRFLNVLKIFFGVEDLSDVFRYRDFQLTVFVPFEIVEVGFDIQDLLKMFHREFFTGLR